MKRKNIGGFTRKVNESVAKLHGSEKSMILRHLSRISEAGPNRTAGGLPHGQARRCGRKMA
jgi:hypothetical protein